MNLCDHQTWLQVSKTQELTIHDTGRLARLLQELAHPESQRPSLLILIGRKAKEIAIREMFPWNNVRKGKRDGIATLRVETSTIGAENPILFAESDPFAAINLEPETSFLCHQTFAHPVQWQDHCTASIYDLIHSRLLCIFADVLCIFADDFEDLEQVADQLKRWAMLGREAHKQGRTHCKVIIVKSGHGPSPSPTYDILERMNVQFSLLRQDLMDFYVSVVVLNLVDDQVSPLARHRRLKELLRQQIDEMCALRRDQGCLYSAVHMNRFFTDALLHLVRTIHEPFNFLQANCRGGQSRRNKEAHFRNFFELCRMVDAPQDAVTFSVASTILFDAYPKGSHSKNVLFSIACELTRVRV